MSTQSSTEVTNEAGSGTSNADASNFESDKRLTSHLLMTMDGNIEVLSEFDDKISLAMSAAECRLPAEKLSELELSCFPDVAEAHPATVKVYIYLRNRILTLWLQNVRNELTLEKCKEEMAPPYDTEITLIRRIHGFLDRHGYINFGVYKPDPNKVLGDPTLAGGTSKRKIKVAVVGAGVSGLAAARQLQSFGIDVTVFESRGRVGGRICTFSKDSYTADMGAAVITGLASNPVAVLARQLPIQLHRIRSTCPLYDQRLGLGAVVRKDRDEAIEKQFNAVLQAAAYLAKSMNLSESAQKNMSLGDAIELIVKLQEKQAKERQIEYWKTMLEIQEKLRKNLHRLMKLREAIGNQHAVYTRMAAEETNSKHSHRNIVTEFERRARKRDLYVAIEDYKRLQKFHTELSAALNELNNVRPAECYLSPDDRRIFDWHLANLEYANGTPVDLLSLKDWDQDDEFELGGNHLFVVDGYRGVPNHLAAGLNIRNNCAVREIRHTESGVELTLYNPTHDNSDTETFTADAVLCTLPLGVLKASVDVPPRLSKKADGIVKFTPSLPAWKVDAIRRLGFGNLNKVILCFDRVFWDASVNIFGHVPQSTESRGEFFQFWSLAPDPTRCPVLVALVAGEAAELVEDLSTDIVAGNALTTLKRLFGPQVPNDVSDTYVTAWRKDPWSRGCYSFVGKQASGADYDLLAAPVAVSPSGHYAASQYDSTRALPPRLFFAGEHTARRYPATVHGALLSGVREAARIADQFLGASYKAGADGNPTPAAALTSLRSSQNSSTSTAPGTSQ